MCHAEGMANPEEQLRVAMKVEVAQACRAIGVPGEQTQPLVTLAVNMEQQSEDEISGAPLARN